MNNQEKKIISHANYQQKNSDKSMTEESESLDSSDSLTDRIVSDAEEMAEKILSQAKEQIKEQKLKVEQELEDWWKKRRIDDEQVIEQAREHGYKEGYQYGLQEAENEVQHKYQEIINQAQSILQDSYRLKEEIIQEAEPKILDLSLLIAQKITIKQLENDPDIIKDMTKEALKNTRELEKIAINVHPRDFAYLQSAREELLLELNGQVELSIFPDPTIKDGGCMIKTTNGTLDATIDTQLNELRHKLYETLGREPL